MKTKNKFQKEVTFEFHIAKHIRKKYEIDESFFSVTGNVVFVDFYQVRIFVQKINDKRAKEQHLSPGEVNAAGLIDEIYHISIKNFFKKQFPGAFNDAINSLKVNVGESNFDSVLLEFINLFPPTKVYKNLITPKQYLDGYTDGENNRNILLEELILLNISNKNPGFKKLKELFDENYFTQKPLYQNVLSSLNQYFRKEELRFGSKSLDLFSFLSAPFDLYGDNLWEQLEFIKREWGIFLDEKLFLKIQTSKDLFKESIVFEQHGGGGGKPPTVVPFYKGKRLDLDHLVLGKSLYKYAEDSADDYEEPEQFTPDTNWMPNLVLIAKNIYVWLDQLSKKYKREIRTLDKIPLEELQLLKKRHINGLWLIGIWERSIASKKIKHLMGNIDAVASAYSLFDYSIAEDLGGEKAFDIFNQNAKKNGIRLASDMVPNHTGIYSKWIIEHPDYFMQSDYPPFPNYKFTGVNLSDDPNIEIRLEDGYWSRKDAAVVFERKDLKTNKTNYFYHGNDGTNMPWNDTAQLNLLKQEVREALIQKIFDVAKRFSVIRFDAAMTLTKRHFSRLWYPQPGKGGDIPSRADYAMSKVEFDKHFPNEFWREVVDKINNEMPHTLLLAEAFWLMEGYFVRTLGMHRVYNSAFMHMMMNEENLKYKELITNTLEFEPEILKRYVNFMSNPDEETAINQFGTDDKYFGVLTLMCTLPGLPMFAHGQIEGYTEKYGMEYKRAYYDEQPKEWLVEKHEKEIFPLLKKRYLFAEVKNFWIYDCYDNHGNINDNVFVYSNSIGDERAIVIYNNKYESINGHVKFSRPKLATLRNENKNTEIIDIAYALGMKNENYYYYIVKEVVSNQEYLLKGIDIYKRGLHLTLKGFEHKVFWEFEEVYDPSGEFENIYKSNLGKGIKDIRKLHLQSQLLPIHSQFENLFSQNIFKKVLNLLTANLSREIRFKSRLKVYSLELKQLKKLIFEYLNLNYNNEEFILSVHNRLNDARTTNYLLEKRILKRSSKENSRNKRAILKLMRDAIKDKALIMVLFFTVNELKNIFNGNKELVESYISKLMLTNPTRKILSSYINDEYLFYRSIILLNIFLEIDKKIEFTEANIEDFIRLRGPKKLFNYLVDKEKDFIQEIFNNDFIQSFLDVNTFDGKQYYSKERFEEIVDWFQYFIIIKYIKSINSNNKLSYKEKSLALRFINKTFVLSAYLKRLSDKAKYIFIDLRNNFEN